jgi:hypothetical protein
LIDHLLAGYKKPADLIGENGLLKRNSKKSGVLTTRPLLNHAAATGRLESRIDPFSIQFEGRMPKD